MLIIFILVGANYINDGYSFSNANPYPLDIKLFAENLPVYSGQIIIIFTPTQAFVFGDNITAEISVNLHANPKEDVFIIQIMFPDALVERDIPPYVQQQDFNYWLTEPTPLGTEAVQYSKTINLMYVSEGVYGLNMTITQLNTNTQTEINYPNVVTVKPFSSIEERITSRLTLGLNIELFGIALIALGPIIVQVINLVEGIVSRKTNAKRKKYTRNNKYVGDDI